MRPGKLLDQVGLIQLHLSWYPLMELRDIYKLLYQGVMGAEHLVSSPEEFTRKLASEFDRLLPDPYGRLLEPVRADQSLLRLNLRIYKSQLGKIEALAPPLLETAHAGTGNPGELRSAWMGFVGSCEQGLILGEKITEIHQFTSWLEKSDFPPVHHSEVYRRQYQPAYRLISSQSIGQLELSFAS